MRKSILKSIYKCDTVHVSITGHDIIIFVMNLERHRIFCLLILPFFFMQVAPSEESNSDLSINNVLMFIL